MSTQSSEYPPIPLYFNQPFQNVRLLELPPDLLEIIASSTDNSKGDELWFKSSPAQTSKDGKGVSEGDLHLCTNERVWLVKQVSTSNSVYVTKTSSRVAEDTSDGDQEMVDENGGEDKLNKGISGAGITAFAKPGNVLELLALPAASYDNVISEQLSRLIPTVHHFRDVETVGEKSEYSMLQVYEHIPAPRNAITKTLASMCVFELPWSSQPTSVMEPLSIKQPDQAFISDRKTMAYIPSSNLLLQTWRNIAEAATISDTKITGDLEADLLLDASQNVDDTMDADGSEIYKAIAKHMFGGYGYLAAHGLITRAESVDSQNAINEMDMARWVGNLILKVDTMETANLTVEKEAFEKKWEDAVPATWVKFCSVEVLGSACRVERQDDVDMVLWQKFSSESGASEAGAVSTMAGNDSKGTPSASTTSKGKRKWHEKFASQRNMKK